MAEKSIIIIGAGIAGLSGGCYGQMNDYQTHIFEQSQKPGGLCTFWKRRGYTIEGCMHYLWGTGPGSSYYSMWEELGALRGRPIVEFESLMSVESADGKVLNLYTNIDRLEQHLLEVAPEDKSVIQKFVKGIQDCTTYDFSQFRYPDLFKSKQNASKLSSLINYKRMMKKWGKTTIWSFANCFFNSYMRDAFSRISANSPQLPILARQLELALAHKNSGGYVVGGSLEFMKAIEKRYYVLGGDIQYGMSVATILTENDTAIGVRLKDGSEYRSDYVISACDGRTTMGMLEEKYINKRMVGYLERLPVHSPVLYVSLGVNHVFKDFPFRALGTQYFLKKPIEIGGKEQQCIYFSIKNYDSTLAPTGKSVLTMILPTDYNYWKSLSENPASYREEKDKVVSVLISLLNQRFPGLVAKVEMFDVATPITFEQWTGNWNGSIYGWDVTPETMLMSMEKSVPGLKNFYMAGQWVEPGGGLHAVGASGKQAIQLLCKENKRPFETMIPS
jgi:phytoene dehydrogenase-like protein